MSFFDTTYNEMIFNKLPWFPGIMFTKDFDTHFMTTETISHLAEITKQQIVRDQIVLEDEEDYYVAKDTSSNTLYICFRNLLMLDIDGVENVKEVTVKLQEFCETNRDHLFHIYESRNGLHIFCVSHKKDYTNLNDIDFMLKHNSDFFYTLYAHVRGWCVRLNKKKNEPKKSITKFIRSVGYGKVCEELISLMKVYNGYVLKYRDSSESKMQ
jgi:hypothetical protein